MKTLKQMLRQPMKTAFGIILVTLAVTVLCVGVGQAIDAKVTAKNLEESFDTVAIQSPQSILDESYNVNWENITELAQWAVEAAEANPGIIEEVSQNGLASTYIRDLIPVSYYESGFSYYDTAWYYTMDNFQPMPCGAPWSCAMFEITLEEIGEPQKLHEEYVIMEQGSETPHNTYDDWLDYENTVQKEIVTTGYVLNLRGKITRVLSLQEGFKDPTGMWIQLQYCAKSLEELESLTEVEPGGRYLVYGMDYYDIDWDFRKAIAADEKYMWPTLEIEEWDMSKFRYATEREKELWKAAEPWLDLYMLYNGAPVTETDYRTINAVSLTLQSSAYDLIQYEDIWDESGNLIEIREITNRTLTDANGNSVTVSAEEYGEYYKIPSIARLEGSAEEFLASEAGAVWQAALDRDTVNNHAFPVIGVDDLGYVEKFATQEARITEGREFTREELETGAAVCVISQELAAANGLTVGDTIHPNFYNADENLPYQDIFAENSGLANPTASFYFSTTPLLGEMEYTIVGIYRSDIPWERVDREENLYAFTPNTIFAPKASIPGRMQYSGLLQFQTVVLHNGRMDDFTDLMNQAGYAGCYLLYDQGYTDIAGNFSDYEALSRQVLQVCAAAYGIIALLYLLLFPGIQGKSLRIMENLGATGRQRRRHVLTGSMALLVPATALGAGAGILLWDCILDAMLASAEVLVEIELDAKVLITIALGQLVLMAVLSAIVAALVARSRKLSNRR